MKKACIIVLSVVDVDRIEVFGWSRYRIVSLSSRDEIIERLALDSDVSRESILFLDPESVFKLPLKDVYLQRSWPSAQQ